jgi:triosephosphate isomerase
MKKVLVIGNWKMHFNTSQASTLVQRLQDLIPIHRDVEVVLAPSFLVLQPLSLQIDRRKFKLAAQNGYFVDEGAFTGEVSFTMLRDLVHYAIIGHSERRYIFSETQDIVANKVRAALRNEITPVLCIGETNTERLDGETRQVLHDQLVTGLHYVTRQDFRNVVVAYEPIWAIGNGVYAEPDKVADAVKIIHTNVKALYGSEAVKDLTIIYGGSVSPDVARSYLDIKGIDGLLVGTDSLNYQQFAAVVEAAYRYAKR